MAPPTTPSGLVLVTGGSGYIAGYCIAQLLDDGWRVRTTVRNLARAEEVRATIGKIAADAGAIEFAAADLNSDAGWADAVAGVDYVLHVASPFPAIAPKSDDELVRPARDGALRVLNAARDAGVKRVVMTSSVAAIAYGRGGREEPFTEADWTDETNRDDTSAYVRSKTIAERAAWAWREAEGGALELVTVNPALVLGPVLRSDVSTSSELIKKLLDGSVPALPRMGFCLADVRDIARLHLLAMTSPAAAGQRFLGSRRILLDERRRENPETGSRRKSAQGAVPGHPRLSRPPVCDFRSGGAGPIIRTGQTATDFIREGAARAGLDDAAGAGDNLGHRQQPAGARLGLARSFPWALDDGLIDQAAFVIGIARQDVEKPRESAFRRPLSEARRTPSSTWRTPPGDRARGRRREGLRDARRRENRCAPPPACGSGGGAPASRGDALDQIDRN